MKMVVDADTQVVVGAHMVGDHAAEIMQVRGLVAACACVLLVVCVGDHAAEILQVRGLVLLVLVLLLMCMGDLAGACACGYLRWLCLLQ
jgi:hypothetical protein